MTFADIDELAHDPALARVHEQGWQSWSPAGTYPATVTSPRPVLPVWQTMAFRPGQPAPDHGFQGEGLVVIDPGDGGPVRIWCAADPVREVPSIRVRAEGSRLVVSANGPVSALTAPDGRGIDEALAWWAEPAGSTLNARVGNVPPPVWCSWYCYWRQVREQDVQDNLDSMDRLDLPFGVVQIDDGFQAGIGDWLDPAPGFGSLPDLAARIIDTGRAAGVWTAPLIVGAGSRLAAEHPDWLVGGADAGHNWKQDLLALDVTDPEAAEHLTRVFRAFRDLGFTYFKVDFMYAGALAGRRRQDCTPLDAYREGLRLIRAAIGEDSVLLGCGAPLLPSVGLVDAMRIGPDIAPHFEPPHGDISQPGQRSALLASAARSFTDGTLWAADPDCMIVRPEIERREEWAEFLFGRPWGLRSCSDPLEALDPWALEVTRRFVSPG